MTTKLEKTISGAIFDFMAFLTTRDEEITLSAHHNASPAVKAIEEFANLRGLDINDANVMNWQEAINAHKGPIIWVEIACKAETCDQCQALGYIDLQGKGKFSNPACNIFGDDLAGDEKVAYRCEACLNAEAT